MSNGKGLAVWRRWECPLWWEKRPPAPSFFFLLKSKTIFPFKTWEWLGKFSPSQDFSCHVITPPRSFRFLLFRIANLEKLPKCQRFSIQRLQITVVKEQRDWKCLMIFFTSCHIQNRLRESEQRKRWWKIRCHYSKAAFCTGTCLRAQHAIEM